MPPHLNFVAAQGTASDRLVAVQAALGLTLPEVARASQTMLDAQLTSRSRFLTESGYRRCPSFRPLQATSEHPLRP
jgi:hypothetical protein